MAALVFAASSACSNTLMLDDGGRPLPGVDGGPADAGLDAGAASDAGLPVRGACSALNSRRCDYLARCGLIANTEPAWRECVAWLSATWCGPTRWSSRVDPSVNTLRYDAVRAQACADAFPTRDCAGWAQEPDPCTRFLTPAAQTRQACYGEFQECVTGVCRGAACPRTCQARGVRGEVCQDTSSCANGLYCRPSSTPGLGQCAAPGQVGEACSASEPCGVGMACDTGRCAVLPADGEACSQGRCDESSWCATGVDGGVCALRRNRGAGCSDDVQCLPGDLCETISGQCAPTQLTLAGAPCGPRQRCPSGSVCAGLTATVPGACVAPGTEGLACGSSQDCQFNLACGSSDGGTVCGPRGLTGAACATERDCGAVHACRGGTCAALPLPGTACTDGRRCLWGTCLEAGDGGFVCAEPGGPGAACTRPGDCASGRCEQGQCLAVCAP